jgi:hypothetical protein
MFRLDETWLGIFCVLELWSMSLLKLNISRPKYQIIYIGFVEFTTINYIKG